MAGLFYLIDCLKANEIVAIMRKTETRGGMERSWAAAKWRIGRAFIDGENDICMGQNGWVERSGVRSIAFA